MTDIFKRFKGKFVPIVNWNFFSTLKEGKDLYNSKTWTGWNDGWRSVATNELGDVIIIKNNAVYEVEHGTGEEPEPKLVTKEIEKLEVFFKALRKFKGFSEKDSIEVLKSKKQDLKELKKQAPRALKYNFEIVIDDIQGAINDKRWLKTKAGQFMKEHEDFTKLVYPELRKNGRFSDVMIFRQPEKKIFLVAGWLKEGEEIEEVKEVVDKYPSPYPVEYGEFKPYDED